MAVAALAGPALFAQNVFDTSGSEMIEGYYFVREVAITNVSETGTIGLARSATGIIEFGTQGTYTFTGKVMDSTTQNRQPTDTTISGSFGVAANGMMQFQSLLSTTSGQPDLMSGGVGVVGPSAFVATTTETANYDMIVGVPVGSGFSVSSLTGLYNFTYLNFQEGHAELVRNAWFTLNMQGNGKAGYSGPITGAAANIPPNDNHTFSQSGGSVTYTLTDSSGGTLSFPFAPDPRVKLIDGDKEYYASPDGQLILGGAVNGYDILIGAKPVNNASDDDVLSFYYLNGIEEDATDVINGNEIFDTFAGSSSATPIGYSILHKRLDVMNVSPSDQTMNINYSVASNGTFQPDGSNVVYTLGSRDLILTGHGLNGQYGLHIGLMQQFSRTSAVFLHPLGVVNSATYAPITNPIAPLEIVELFGQNLTSASAQAQSLPLPTVLNKTQVFINGIAAPLFEVNPTLIKVLVPLRISPVNGVKYATVQVISDSIPSDPVTVFVRKTAPGVYSAGANGVGGAAVLHANGVLVDDDNPAVPGEYVELFLTGLGSVTPGIGDGAPGLPPPNASLVDAKPTVLIDGIVSPDVPYAGIAPGLAGLYQVNAQIPNGTASGPVSLKIVTPDGSTMQTTVSVQTSN